MVVRDKGGGVFGTLLNMIRMVGSQLLESVKSRFMVPGAGENQWAPVSANGLFWRKTYFFGPEPPPPLSPIFHQSATYCRKFR